MRLLILGGTTEASGLAAALTGRPGIHATLSLAGRTVTPAAARLPTRIGGFGGIDGLARHLSAENVDAVIDATHPFAAQMSTHAVAACARAGVPLLALVRPAWQARDDDRWMVVPDIAAAATHLATLAPMRVFLTTGRLDLAAFLAAPQHRYLVRTIDAPPVEACPPDVTLIRGRGPFAVDEEAALMAQHGIELLVTKNSGGAAGLGKLAAARRRDVPVLMVARPPAPPRETAETVADTLAWIATHAAPR